MEVVEVEVAVAVVEVVEVVMEKVEVAVVQVEVVEVAVEVEIRPLGVLVTVQPTSTTDGIACYTQQNKVCVMQ